MQDHLSTPWIAKKGIIRGGSYVGQSYSYPVATTFPRWWSVRVLANSHYVRRDVREEYLETEVLVNGLLDAQPYSYRLRGSDESRSS